MTRIFESENLENLRNLLRPMYEKEIFKVSSIEGLEDFHENIGLILGPCTNEQFSKFAVQLIRACERLKIQNLKEEPFDEVISLLVPVMQRLDLNNEKR